MDAVVVGGLQSVRIAGIVVIGVAAGVDVVANDASVGGHDAVGVGGQYSVCLVLDGVVDVLELASAARSWCECRYLWSCCVASSSIGVVDAVIVVTVVVAGVAVVAEVVVVVGVAVVADVVAVAGVVFVG